MQQWVHDMRDLDWLEVKMACDRWLADKAGLTMEKYRERNAAYYRTTSRHGRQRLSHGSDESTKKNPKNKKMTEETNKGEENINYLMCHRVEDYVPRLVSQKVECSLCGRQVWVAASSPKDDKKIICIPCAVEISKDLEEVRVMLPTQKQLDDIQSDLTRDKN